MRRQAADRTCHLSANISVPRIGIENSLSNTMVLVDTLRVRAYVPNGKANSLRARCVLRSATPQITTLVYRSSTNTPSFPKTEGLSTLWRKSNEQVSLRPVSVPWVSKPTSPGTNYTKTGINDKAFYTGTQRIRLTAQIHRANEVGNLRRVRLQYLCQIGDIFKKDKFKGNGLTRVQEAQEVCYLLAQQLEVHGVKHLQWEMGINV